jgi:antitoxin component of MazEF toxin-antitoxin module
VGERCIILNISVRFPLYDLNEVVARMRAHNAAADDD